MGKENVVPPPEIKKIHKTHFPVVKAPLKDTHFDSGFEWIDKGNGRWVRVPKKAEESAQTEDQK